MKLGGISMITFSELQTPPVTCLRSASGGRWMSSTISVAARAEALYEQLQPLLQFFFDENALGVARDQHTVTSKSLKRLGEALAELALLRPQLTFADPGYVAVCHILTNGLHNVLVDLKCEVDQSKSKDGRQDTGSLNIARRIACREVPPALWYYAHAIELLDKTLRSTTLSSQQNAHAPVFRPPVLYPDKAVDFLIEFFGASLLRASTAGKHRRLSPDILKSDGLLAANNRQYTEEVLVLQKLEQSHEEESNSFNTTTSEHLESNLKYLIYWSSYSTEILSELECRPPDYSGESSNSSRATRRLRACFLLSAIKSLWLAFISSDDERRLSAHQELWHVASMAVEHVLVQLQRYHQIPTTSSQYPHNDIVIYGDFRIVSMLPIMSSGDETGIESPNPSQPARDNRGLSPQPESGPGPGPAQTQQIELAASPVRRLQRRPSADQELISSQSTQEADQPGYGGSAGHVRQNFDLPGITSWWSLDSNRGANHPSNTAPVVGEPVSMYQSSGHAAGLREVEISPSGALSTSTAGARPFERGVSSLDTDPPCASQFLPSSIRVFKGFSDRGEYVRLWTTREGAPPHSTQALLGEAELVPVFAFRGKAEFQEIFLRFAGGDMSLRYKLNCVGQRGNFDPEELYNFMSALLGARFEAEYPVASVSLQPIRSAQKTLRSVRMQLWIEDHTYTAFAGRESGSSTTSTDKLSSPRHRHIPTQDSFQDFQGSKFFIFSGSTIFVLLVTDRMVLREVPRPVGSKTGLTSLIFAPNTAKLCSTVGIAVIPGDSRVPAGIPLDQAGIGFVNLDETSEDCRFEDFRSVTIEFQTRKALEEFRADYNERMAEWTKRCTKPEIFRRNERNVHLVTASRLTKGDRGRQ